MKHDDDGVTLKLAYQNVGKITFRHNSLESEIIRLIVDLFPSHLRPWIVSRIPRYFSPKVDLLNSLAEHHQLLDARLRVKIKEVLKNAEILSKQRNKLIHAREEIEIADFDILPNGEIDIKTTTEFYDRGKSNEKTLSLDTSPESLEELIESYKRIDNELLEIRQSVQNSLGGSMNYPEPDLPEL